MPIRAATVRERLRRWGRRFRLPTPLVGSFFSPSQRGVASPPHGSFATETSYTVESAGGVLGKTGAQSGGGYVSRLRHAAHDGGGRAARSEERRVGKECRSR